MERIEKRIVVLYRLRKERINELLKEYHLSYEDYEIVLALHYAEGLSIEDIKKETKIDERLIESIIDHLQKKNYLYIENNRIYLTEATKKLYPQLKRVVKKGNEEMIRQMSTDEYHEIIETLDKIIEVYESSRNTLLFIYENEY